MPKFVPRQRKHKVREREKRSGLDKEASTTDSNAAEILPALIADRERKRQELRAELRKALPKISGKRQKRLEKYIDTKLRKEENLDLIKKLALTKVDTSLLRSSKTLGTAKDSKREILSRALHERQAGISVDYNEKLLYVERSRQTPESDLSSEDDYSQDRDRPEGEDGLSTGLLGTQFLSTIGHGLKRPLDVDGDGMPLLKKRKKRNIKGKKRVREKTPEWNGFDSESLRSGEASVSDSASDSDLEQGEKSESSMDTSPDEEDASSDEYSNGSAEPQQRSSIFKAWASQKRNESLNYVSATVDDITASADIKGSFKPREPDQDPLPEELQTKYILNSGTKPFSVDVDRSIEIQTARLELPVVAEEQKIMEAINHNDIVVIWGATGSGKTTQVPQFLYEAGYGNSESNHPGLVGVTQPRRVAAVSMSSRVGKELGGHSSQVSYQIRFEGNVHHKTAIKFMTDGVLLREVGNDISLQKYSAIIIDEVHERMVNTDILIGMMSRVVRLRKELSQEDLNIKPLKLIIMSATLRLSDFVGNKALFPEPPPVIKAEGRQHPVTLHFSRTTEHNYVEEMQRKLSKGHRKLPPGGILVFLTGQSEIKQLAKKLQESFGSKNGLGTTDGPSVRLSGADAPIEVDDIDAEIQSEEESDANSSITGLENEETEDQDFNLGEDAISESPMHILPLYSLLPTQEQLKVFEAPPEGSRLVVLATNVAETSLTIPGIRYVFDCGRAKERQYDSVTGVQSFKIGWISKASATQRAGRAGRTGPGHCYRLYSSAVYERDFEEYSEPEILRTPIEGVVLQLKSMDLQNVINFPFPTPPERQSLIKAEKLLSYLGALTSTGQITPLGRTIASFPLAPRFSRILLLGTQHDCMPYIVNLVAALSISEIFIPDSALDLKTPPSDPEAVFTTADHLAEDARSALRKAYNTAHRSFTNLDARSDALKLLSVLIFYASSSDPTRFCAENFLRPKGLHEALLLRKQLTKLLYSNGHVSSPTPTSNLPPPSPPQIQALKQMLTAGFIDQVAIRADLTPIPPSTLRKTPRSATDVPYLPLFPLSATVGKSSFYVNENSNNEPDQGIVYIHPSSTLAQTSPASMPSYVSYSHLSLSSSSSIAPTPTSTIAAISKKRRPRTRMHPLTPISGAQLAALAHGTPLLEYSKPVTGKGMVMPKSLPPQPLNESRSDKTGKAHIEERRECWVVPYLRGHDASQGWPLPARKVVQRRVRGRGWVVE